MSRLVRSALERSRATNALSRLVLAIMASYAKPGGLSVWPSQLEIARKAGCSVRAIQKRLKDLEERGEIRLLQSGRGRGSSTYHV